MLNNLIVIITTVFIILYFPAVLKNPYQIFRLLIIILFTKLIFLLIGIPVTLFCIFVDAVMGMLVLSAYNLLHSNSIEFRLPGLTIFILYTLVVILSISINRVESYFESFSFYRHLLVAYFFFLFALNFPFSQNQLHRLIKLIMVLVFLQFFGGIYKIIFIGLQEKYVGLLSLKSGSLNAIFPLIGIGFIISLHFIYKPVKYFWLYICILLFIGVIGIKRGFFAFLPLELLFFYYLYVKFVKNIRIPMMKIIIYSPIIILLLYGLIIISISLNPLFNKEYIVGGSVDIRYAFETSMSHNLGEENSKYAEGRIGSTIRLLNERITNVNPKNLFGYGAGLFVREDNSSSNITIYNVARLTILPSLARQLIQIGLLGSFFVIIFYIYLIRLSWKKLQDPLNPLLKAIAISNILIGSIFLYDYILYSPATFNTYISSFFFYTFTGLLHNKYLNVEFQKNNKE